MDPIKKAFPDFIPSSPKEAVSAAVPLRDAKTKVLEALRKRLGPEHALVRLAEKALAALEADHSLDGLTQLKSSRSKEERLQWGLALGLLAALLLAWKGTLPLMRQIDQTRNDLAEQAQVIRMEEQNNAFLQKIRQDRNGLLSKMGRVYAAVPQADERAEEVISMLEDVGQKNNILIDSISIRKLPESQFGYDDLWGVAEAYEYTFSVESALPNVLSFIGSLRASLRLMDIITLEVEESKGGYRAGFSMVVYHLVE